MNNDESLDLLDLDNGSEVDTLPPPAPFAAPRPKKPWLLLGVGITVIILATYIIVSTISGDSSSSIEVDLDAPAIIVDENAPLVVGGDAPQPTPVSVQPAPAPIPAPAPQPAPVAKTQPAAPAPAIPVRVIEDRKPVTFNPDAAPVAKPAAKPAAKPVAKKTAPKPVAKTVAKANGGWYVQFSSHSTRALAERAQKQIVAAHPSLFAGQEFVILAAQLKNGTTTYRLRIPFATSAAANGFCRNAKSDGQDCYVTK